MDDTGAEIERLKAQIAGAEMELAALEEEIIDLRRELESFTRDYNRKIRPLVERLDVMRAVVADLEAEKLTPPQLHGYASQPADGWSPPPDYVSVEEQFWRTWIAPRGAAPSEPDPPVRQVILDDDPERMLKRLYRALARRYHPDLAADPDERTRRTRLMAEINSAYANRDLNALHLLSQQPEGATPDVPLAALALRELKQIAYQLEARLAALRHERSELLNGELMWLSIQSKFAAREGRNLLREMAAQLEREYAACLDRIDELRAL
ncbi:MAG TPA: hypothetical protein PKD09_02095 [Aggregatilinea sp.]|uniref:hypothetical protein n=1 Tax=Aggregatilinea sp. TaxID=2806333 RepID=UPI002CC422EC|nr:hypothetical protein [Aggregatilinea sp.]HML20409.1 hypothetical protein [Aggregatilinea sp.]